MSLLEQALALPDTETHLSRSRSSDQVRARAELAIAFFEGRVSRNQAAAALSEESKSPVRDKSLDTRLGCYLGTAIRRGVLTAQLAAAPEPLAKTKEETETEPQCQ